MGYRDNEQVATMIANLADKTGRPLDAWLGVLGSSGATKHGELRDTLKDLGVSHGYANMIAHIFREEASGPAPSAEALIDAQYEDRPNLRPVYERVLRIVEALGPDVEVAAKKTGVSLRRSKQFALVQPSTKSRIDLGLQLKGTEATAILEEWAGMCSHRIRLSEVDDITAEVVDWLRAAYEAAA